MSKVKQKAIILMAEDNLGEAELTREALKEWKISAQLFVVADGEEALAFLHRTEAYPDAPKPDLILLDLNMPKMGGREALKVIKKDPALRKIPVIILTTSQNSTDIEYCYNLYANSFITKPVDFEKFTDVVKNIERYWFSIVQLPNG